MRTGTEYLRSLNDGRRVFVDGESVKDVTAHPAFRQAARSVANLYDIAADPALRERMTFASPKTGAPVWRAWQIPRSHADLRARRLFSETWAEATFGLMGRSPDHVAGFFTGYLVYDMMHYYLHHFRPRGPLGRMLRERHMRHHFQDDTRGFGISAPYWDEVFRTSPRSRRDS